MKNKLAFTLSEVLITLVIIGVVAALIIPTTINNYRKHEYVSKLKKAYSTLASATNRIIAEEGSPKASIGGWCSSKESMAEQYKKHLQIVKDCGTGTGCFSDVTYRLLNGNYASEGWNLNQLSRYKIILADGTQIIMMNSDENCAGSNWNSQNACGNIFVDINGSKGPNQFGRDLFFFELRENGLYPTSEGSESYYACNLTTGSYAYGCTAKVLRENAMNY